MTTLTPVSARCETPMLAHVSIAASAGSGKTFQLTNRYLQLIANGEKPSTIFASTFTRLAAGQIRDKILCRLAEAALDDKKRSELSGFINYKLSRAEAIQLLAKLARQMHLMQVRTLDSFFAAVVKSFAIELDVPLGADVVNQEQATSLRSQAISQMLDEQEPQKLIDLLRLLTLGASDRGITATIDSAVRDLYEVYREAPPHAWECVPALAGKLSPAKLVQAIAALVETACGADKRFAKAHQENCDDAQQWNWNGFLGGGLAKRIAAGESSYYNKPIAPELIAVFRPLIDHAKAELVGRVRDQTIATRDLLSIFARHFEELKRRERALSFDDLTFAMRQAGEIGAMDSIGFRLDATLRHMLLDEFQDTSIGQWRGLEPLVMELISVAPPQRSFFCVGDVKQSIYGWRDAAPEILDGLPQLLTSADGFSAIQQQSLTVSYRSAQTVIDAVNLVFENLAQNAALQDQPDAVHAFGAGFKTHETAKKDLPGYVELRECRTPREEESADVVRLRTAAELAADLHRQNPALSIALLTRTNTAVARLLYELGPSRLNVRASGRGGGPLIDAPPVNVILDLLQLADHPDDTIAAFNVAKSPVGPHVGLIDHANLRERRMAARRIRSALLNDGYGATMSTWVKKIGSACDARELRRLTQLVDLADAFDSRPSLRPADFVQVVEQTRVADPQPAPVQVMTVHQSKGLEFDAVILAELGSRLTDAKNPPVVLERAGEIGPITRVCRYMNQEALKLVPELNPLFERHCRRTVRESLSLLYVAMTRAKCGLYMLLDVPRKNSNGENSKAALKTLGGVVRCALSGGGGQDDGHLFTIGDQQWHAKVPLKPDGPVVGAKTDSDIKLTPPSGGSILRGWASRAASQLDDERSLRVLLRLADSDARQRGLAIHALFQQIEWLDDFAVDADALEEIVRAIAPRQADRWIAKQAADFRKMIQTKAIREALTCGSRQRTSLEVSRELPFARLVDGRVQRGSIDRVVIERRGGRIASVSIIDFKTDAISPADAVLLGTHYRPQLQAYRQAVVEMLNVDEKSISIAVLFVEPGLLVNL
jgi:ATP-dependent helicase/nuclease subunit A